ncbi:hypothetical protein ACGC1H_003508 [Rhizoctonia solani]
MHHQFFESNPSPLLQLPKEVLSNIFVDVVFEHTKDEASWSLSIFVGQDIRILYRRPYCLFGVCCSWRDIILATGTLWSVILMVMDPSKSTDQQQPFELSLERARGSKLHLAVAKSFDSFSALIKVLTKYGPQFGTIDLRAGSTDVIKKAVDTLLQHGASGTLSEPSLLVTNESPLRFDAFSGYHGINPYGFPLNASFTAMMEFLSVFRLGGTNAYWDNMRFSSRLVELHIEEVVLGHDTDLVTFLQAASSASELRNLTILSVITSRSILDTNTCSPITFPNLRSLFLGGLCYNTLETLLRTIDSCTHRMSLVLGRRSLMIRDGDIEIRAIVSNSLQAYRFLEYIPVDILTIFGHEWFHYHIHGLLEMNQQITGNGGYGGVGYGQLAESRAVSSL